MEPLKIVRVDPAPPEQDNHVSRDWTGSGKPSVTYQVNVILSRQTTPDEQARFSSMGGTDLFTSISAPPEGGLVLRGTTVELVAKFARELSQIIANVAENAAQAREDREHRETQEAENRVAEQERREALARKIKFE